LLQLTGARKTFPKNKYILLLTFSQWQKPSKPSAKWLYLSMKTSWQLFIFSGIDGGFSQSWIELRAKVPTSCSVCFASDYLQRSNPVERLDATSLPSQI